MKNSGKYYTVEQANFSTLYFRNLLSNCKVKFFITWLYDKFLRWYCQGNMLWFNFILGLSFSFFSIKIIILYYHTKKKKKFKLRIKLNHSKYNYYKSHHTIAIVVWAFNLPLLLLYFFNCAFNRPIRQGKLEQKFMLLELQHMLRMRYVDTK